MYSAIAKKVNNGTETIPLHARATKEKTDFAGVFFSNLRELIMVVDFVFAMI